jgi:ankyrin repeat protein
LDHGADVNVPSPNVHWTKELVDARHVTPLLAAVAAGNKSMTKFLIDRGADLNAKGELGDTALHLAARNGFQAVVEVLLTSHAAVNAQNGSGATPLFQAVQGGQTKIIQLLLDAGADANHKDGGGRTVLNHAIGTSPEILQTLLAAGTNPNTEDTEGRTPLSYAAERDSFNVVKLLVAAKADPNAGKLDAPLLGAIRKNDTASAELLLQAGANPNANSPVNWEATISGAYYGAGGQKVLNPLYFATTVGRLPLVRLLLKYHADPNDVQTDGQSMLFRTLAETNILAALLEAGGNVEASRADGWTLLDVAVDLRIVPAVRMLLQFKANPNNVPIQGRSILFNALSETNILAALLDAGASVDPVTKDDFRGTPLCVAARDDNAAAAKLLLEHGANPNVRAASGATPLHLATYKPAAREVFELLLAHQADPNVRNSNGETPLDMLKKSAAPNNFAARPGVPLPLPLPQGLRPGMSGEPADSKPKPLAGELAEVLRQHGALDKLPDWDCITVSRPAADFSFPILHQGTNDWNHFTLLETLFNFFNSSQSYSVPQGNNTWAGYQLNAMLPFADLSRVTIVRPTHGSTNETRRVVNLLNSTNGLDVSKDLPLEFGDVVEIPERDHALGEHAAGLTDSERASLAAFAEATAQLVVHGHKVELPFWRLDGRATLGFLLNQAEAQRILLSSSDLSRVKVTRHDAKTGQQREWILDCRSPAPAPNGVPNAPGGLSPLSYQWNPGANNSAPSPGLWLRDGDVIEVPEKP